MPKPKTIAAYIAAAPTSTRAHLRQMHTAIRSAAPGATEAIKWGMPAYSYKRMLVAFAVYKHHIGFYPTPSTINEFAKDVTAFKWAKGSVQFPHNKKLPLTLVKQMTAFRARQALEKDAKWRTVVPKK